VVHAVCSSVRRPSDYAWSSRGLTNLLRALKEMPEARAAVLTAAVDRAAASVHASAFGMPEHISTVVALLEMCRGQQQLQEQLIDAVCTSIRSGTVAWHVTVLRPLLQALEASPAARLSVLTAAVEVLFDIQNNNSSNTLGFGVLLSKQTDASMLLLSELLLSQQQLSAAYFGRFAAAVTSRTDSYPLLQQLLSTAAVKGALDRVEVQQLVTCQVANLQRMAAVPQFTWHMPQAKIPNFPQVCRLSSFMCISCLCTVWSRWCCTELQAMQMNCTTALTQHMLLSGISGMTEANC
jgi:hypothetical protein